ncbi:MAG: hypothetical protein ACLTQG_25655 [Hungatella sp.]|uniref:hypothetical protein n=1 Tax=Hungatella TaxID=1649459 RepID=UPI001A9A4E9C|nr:MULTISPECIES: hypothetical protein [Hungatella]
MKKLYYTVSVMEEMIFSWWNCEYLLLFEKYAKKVKKSIDNFPYRKYNYLVMQLGISKSISKRKRRVH